MIYRNGDRLCNCTLLQKCGSGSYGEVWLAEDAIGTRVALKIIANHGSYSERELAGLRNYRECNHPNLLKIRYVEITEDRICCTMDAADDLNRGEGEYLPDTLANRLQRSGRMDGREIALMLDGLLAGLEELHRRKLVHRDIKPDNILWVNGRPTLADAGLIAPDGRGSLVGTPGFLSPKLMAGHGAADASDDFYALGKVIYCALTGLPVREYPGLPEEMTISVDAGLNRALRESCTHPVYSAAEFRRLLQGEQDQFGGRNEPRRPGRKSFCAGICSLGKVAAWGILLFLIVGSLLAGLLLWGRVREMEQRHIPEPVPAMSESELHARLKEAEEELARSQEKIAEAQRQHQEFLEKMQERKAKWEKKLKFSASDSPRTGTPGPAVTEESVPAPERSAGNVALQKPVVAEESFPAPARSAGNVALQKPVVAEESVPAGEKPYSVTKEMETQKDPDRELQKEVQKLAVEQFRKLGFFSEGGRLLPVLLEYELLTADQISDLLLKGSGNPRLQTKTAGMKGSRAPSPLEQELARICSRFFYPDFDPDVVKRRQNYWRGASGTNAGKQNAMLTDDPVMQAVALDALIRSGINRILVNGKLPQEEKELLRSLLLMRYSLLDPGRARLYFD